MSNRTLDEYYKQENFNPCTFTIEGKEDLKRQMAKRDNLYINRLKISPGVWKGAHVLEFGCCSGESSLPLAMRGANFTFVDPVEDFLIQLKELYASKGFSKNIIKVEKGTLADNNVSGEFDVVIAEGFLSVVPDREQAVRKLFQYLKPGGLLITSWNDPYGLFIEYFKSLLGHLEVRKEGKVTLDEKVEAIRPYFEEDFLKIPSDRSFAQWVKDQILSEFFHKSQFYSYPQMTADLNGLAPEYFSSHPSYQMINELTWFKKVLPYENQKKQILDGYAFRAPSFILGEGMDNKEMCQFLISDEAQFIRNNMDEILQTMTQIIDDKDTKTQCAKLDDFLQEFESSKFSLLKELMADMRKCLNELTPQTYKGCRTLRELWGATRHFIVLRKSLIY